MDSSCKKKEIKHCSHQNFCEVNTVHQIIKVSESSGKKILTKKNQYDRHHNGNYHDPNGTWEFKKSVIKVCKY